MNGVLVLDKPAGFTSFDAVAVLRKLTGERKIGHTGTLDPMATGVLPMLLGKAAKAADLLPDTDKAYRAEFTLGKRFDTGDSTGRVLEERDVPVSRAQLEAALDKFRGEIDQMPPMVSAVSIGGKRLYEYARQGVEVPRKPRKVRIFRLELAHYDEAARAGALLVRCSKGTYIRTLIEDIAGEMGALGAMTALRRTAACGFMEADACPLETLRARPEDIPARLRPTEITRRCGSARPRPPGSKTAGRWRWKGSISPICPPTASGCGSRVRRENFWAWDRWSWRRGRSNFSSCSKRRSHEFRETIHRAGGL